MNSDCVEELGPHGRVEARGSFLDQAQPEVDMAE